MMERSEARRPRFLVTAGNTREAIDAVRDWGNRFTGGTGLAIAMALAESVGEVDLLTSNLAHLADLDRLADPAARFTVRGAPFQTHADLKSALAARMAAGRWDGVFMTAAVADYRPQRVYEVIDRQPDGGDGREVWIVRDAQAEKVKSDYDEIAVLGRRTEKLVDLFRTVWGHRGLLVKFKLQVGCSSEELLRLGESSRVQSGADYLVANTLEMVEGSDTGAYLLWQGGREWIRRSDLPLRMVGLAQSLSR